MKDVLDLKNMGRKHFYAGAIIGDFLYYSNWNSKGLFRVDLQSDEVEIVDVFESSNTGKLYNFAVPFENQVWFIPCALEERIAIYDVNKGNLEYLSLPKAKRLGQYELFKDYYIVGRNVWLIPYSYDAVLKINVDDKKMTRLDDKKVDVAMGGLPQFIKSCKYEEKIFLCPWGYDKVGVVNTDTLEINELDRNIPQRTFRNILTINDKLYLIPFDISSGLLEYNLRTQEWLSIEPGGNLEGEYIAVFYDEKSQKLVLFPYTGHEMLLLDVDTWKSDVISINIDGKEITENPYWCEVRKMGNQVWVIAEGRGISELIYKGMDNIEIFDPLFSKDMIIREIEMILNQDKRPISSKRNVGASIYEAVLRL